MPENPFAKYRSASQTDRNPFAKYKPVAVVEPIVDPIVQPVSEPESGRGLMGIGSDAVSSFGAGANILAKIAGDIYGLTTGDMDNYLSQQGQRGIDYFNERKTPQLLQMESGRKAKIDAADGEWAKAGTAFWETVKSPSLLTSFMFEPLKPLG